VAAAVGDLPLAVEQAGSLLADTGMTADKYLRLPAERAHDVLDHEPGAIYPLSLAASWAVAFDRLASDDPAALDLLTLVAWCGPEPVPLPLLTDHPYALPDWLRPLTSDPLVLARCTGILHRRGIATVSPHGLQLHRGPGGAAARPQPRFGRHGGHRVLLLNHGVTTAGCGAKVPIRRGRADGFDGPLRGRCDLWCGCGPRNCGGCSGDRAEGSASSRTPRWQLAATY
jgi:hypothetical protein